MPQHDDAIHYYQSTACWHANHDPERFTHDRCRKVCKFCGARCDCACHKRQQSA